jgi:hypothetical protein
MQDPKADQIHVAAVLFALRSVAIFEAAKAILFLLLGCGVVDLIHNSVDAITEKNCSDASYPRHRSHARGSSQLGRCLVEQYARFGQ